MSRPTDPPPTSTPATKLLPMSTLSHTWWDALPGLCFIKVQRILSANKPPGNMPGGRKRMRLRMSRHWHGTGQQGVCHDIWVVCIVRNFNDTPVPSFLTSQVRRVCALTLQKYDDAFHTPQSYEKCVNCLGWTWCHSSISLDCHWQLGYSDAVICGHTGEAFFPPELTFCPSTSQSDFDTTGWGALHHQGYNKWKKSNCELPASELWWTLHGMPGDAAAWSAGGEKTLRYNYSFMVNDWHQ